MWRLNYKKEQISGIKAPPLDLRWFPRLLFDYQISEQKETWGGWGGTKKIHLLQDLHLCSHFKSQAVGHAAAYRSSNFPFLLRGSHFIVFH